MFDKIILSVPSNLINKLGNFQITGFVIIAT